MTEYSLPFPPSLNHYWRHVVVRGRVRVLISEAGRLYRQEVGVRLLGRGGAPAGRRLRVLIDCHPPDRRVRDLDNLPKGLLDALKHAGAYADDGLIDELTVRRRGVVRGGRVDVRVEVLP